MKDFLAKLPPLLATISKAFLNALMEQMREVARILQTFLRFLGRLLLRLAKRLWAIYYRIETQILGVLVDFGLAVFALRYFILLLGIGIVLVYFKQWIIAIVYIMMLSIAVFRFFQIDSKTIAQENELHKQSRYTFIRLLRWPSRILASVVLVYASLQFAGWRPLNVPWLHKFAAEGSGKITYANAPTNIYSAIVSQDKASFTFPVEYKEVWKWGECGGNEYSWMIEVNKFKFGPSLFNPMGAGDYSGSGNLNQLIMDKAQSDLWEDRGSTFNVIEGEILCFVNESQDAIIININNRKTLNTIFYYRPQMCVFKFRDCDKTIKTQVRINYQ